MSASLYATTPRSVESFEKIAPANSTLPLKLLREVGGSWKVSYSDGGTTVLFGKDIRVRP